MSDVTVYRRCEAYVYLADAGARKDGWRVLDSDSASGHDDEPVARGLDKLCNGVGSPDALLLATRCENPIGACGADIFKGLEEIRGNIERAMEGDGERAGYFEELTRPFDIDVSVGR